MKKAKSSPHSSILNQWRVKKRTFKVIFISALSIVFKQQFSESRASIIVPSALKYSSLFDARQSFIFTGVSERLKFEISVSEVNITAYLISKFLNYKLRHNQPHPQIRSIWSIKLMSERSHKFFSRIFKYLSK